VDSFVDNFEMIWNTGGAALYDQLLADIRGDSASFPIVFASMALDWQQVTELKDAIRSECPEINSHSFRTRPQDHMECDR